MTDTHCHLSFSQYDADRDAVLDRAGIVGVKRIVNPGTDLKQSRAAVELASRHENVYAGVGTHPQDIADLTLDSFDALAELARRPRVVAIGEVGLEVSARAAELSLQEEWLERFTALALEVGKPLIFHVRNAHKEFRAFLADVGWPDPRGAESAVGQTPLRHASAGRSGVVHCFSGTVDDARWYVERGLLLGITGIVTFPNAEGLHAVLRAVPLTSLLLETDSPFLAPQSHRGKRNEPAYLREIAETVATLTNGSFPDVERATDLNAARLFRFS